MIGIRTDQCCVGGVRVWLTQECKGSRSRSRGTVDSFPEMAGPFENSETHDWLACRWLKTSNQELPVLQSQTEAKLEKTCLCRCEADSRIPLISDPLPWPLFDELSEIATECLVGLLNQPTGIGLKPLGRHGRRQPGHGLIVLGDHHLVPGRQAMNQLGSALSLRFLDGHGRHGA